MSDFPPQKMLEILVRVLALQTGLSQNMLAKEQKVIYIYFDQNTSVALIAKRH
jgi:hypothetical protein